MAGTKAKKSSKSKSIKKGDRIRILAPPAELNAMDDDLPVYLPGMPMEEGEELQVDPSAYIMLHELRAGWPCLSFSVCPDNQGALREGFPASAIVCAGTQADVPSRNEVMLMKWSGLTKTLVADSDDDDDDDDESDNEAANPCSTIVSWSHQGGVNRLRWHGGSGMVATWSEVGKVFIWRGTELLQQLDGGEYGNEGVHRVDLKPVQRIAHGTEGFALDWSREGALLSGDCNGQIILSQGDSSRNIPKAHTGSVEDLQWSPRADGSFASASADGSIRLWDTRLSASSVIASAHGGADVNVISWNTLSDHLLASGGDDGVIRVWDLRNASQALCHQWHKEAITSIEWSPHDPSCLTAAGADHQVTLWDFTVTASESMLPDVPAELLFIHQGQRDVKEVHWHPQMTGTLISTAADGFNIFRTISI